ncbi:molybdenum cofactor guanylyltransferase [Streptomyces sp. LX-29]|uniref:NTP transferase domain-containing protein n=1 Tax=Streptomyces sp. LX-29 TaxID=2900152 RepID=UPI00240DD410|nr:NTP transferase domain-containing protein [Streptomyces sp. LX-29]WFB08521.1 molybdenum cofactor guanylyltransferase [Streptomyces sp. LX-29]
MSAGGYDAVVLAGGAARRLGGADKPGLSVGGRPLLDRVLSACADAGRTVVVGPRRTTGRPVRWTREAPPGGGPLAALAAGLGEVTAPVVLVVSADLPFLTAATVRALRAGLGGAAGGDGVLSTDASGREQPLVAVYRAEALRRELGLLAAEHGTLSGLPLRLLTAELSLGRLHQPTASFDCDTWDDIGAARARIREHGHVLDEWITAVKAELGVDLDVDTAALLDLARDAAHGVARPAAPLTTFLVGYAAAQRGGGPEALADAMRKATDLAARWAAEATESGATESDAAGTPAAGGAGQTGGAGQSGGMGQPGDPGQSSGTGRSGGFGEAGESDRTGGSAAPGQSAG